LPVQLVAISGSNKGDYWAIEGDGLVIGRDPQCDVILPDSIVSRRHCRLKPVGYSVHLEDLGSRNPALVNGKPLRECELRIGDEIALGAWRFVLVSAARGGDGPGHGKRTATKTWSWESGEPAVLKVDSARPVMDPRPGTVQDLAALFDAGRAFSGSMTMAELMDTIACRIRERFRPLGLWIALVRRERVLSFCEGEGIDDESTADRRIIEAMQKALRDGDGLLSGRAIRAENRVGSGKKLVFTLVSPVTLGRENLAVIALATEVPHGAYDEEDLRFLVLLSQSLAPRLYAVRDLERLRRDNERLRQHLGEDSELVGNSRAIRKVRRLLTEAAETDLSVLLTGATGTGKELAARLIHAQSERHEGPFVTVNCAAIPRELFESQFFGYERGAFTGADRAFLGLLAEAHKGTLFLDEVGDLSLDNQARILRAIELGTFRRIGAKADTRVDIRAVSATNKDLSIAVKTGAFRDDLYHRLSGFAIDIPPLCERRSDIPLLAQYFLDTGKNQAKRPFVTGFSAEALAHLRSRSWPGNVRQLRNCVLRSLSGTQQNLIQLDTVRRTSAADNGEQEDEAVLPLAEVEKRHIESVLRFCEGNVSATAKALQIGRTTLYKRMEEYGIRV